MAAPSDGGEIDACAVRRTLFRHAAMAVAALVASSSASALPPIDLADIASGEGGFVINGVDVGDTSGDSVSGAGDVNGDGLADLIISARGADPGGVLSAGESYVIFGKADGAPIDIADVIAGVGPPAGFVINGIDLFDQSGASVSGAGDVNGDTLDDLIVGAFGGDPNGENSAGETYIVFGKADTAAVNLADIAANIGPPDSPAGFVINGIDADDESGWSVSGAGDVNGDGLADIIIGAPRADPNGDGAAGETYIVFGKADGTAVELTAVAAGVGGFIINGIDAGDESGASVAGAGDVNGDRLDDVIIGAAQADPGGNDSAGESYVVFGKADGGAVDLSDIAAGVGPPAPPDSPDPPAGFVINGAVADDQSGSSVSGAGDIDNDGLADLIIGALGADPNGESSAGQVYIVFGKADGEAVDLAAIGSGAGGAGGFVINGIKSGDRAGSSVAGIGDMNDDELGDVIIGARGADPNDNSQAGDSYVVFGKADGAPIDLATIAAGEGGFIISGVDAGDNSGSSVSGAADINGDNVVDIIVGAPGADPNDVAAAGETYVIFGPVSTPACPADLNEDGVVNAADLAAVLGAWGPYAPCPPYVPADLDQDCDVDAADLATLLGSWGACR